MRPDQHQQAHIARLAAVQARMQSLSDKRLQQHLERCEAIHAQMEAAFPSAWGWPGEKWQTVEQRTIWFDTPEGEAWLHWTYGLQGAIGKEIVEARREQERRIKAVLDTGILRGQHLNRSVIG